MFRRSLWSELEDRLEDRLEAGRSRGSLGWDPGEGEEDSEKEIKEGGEGS